MPTHEELTQGVVNLERRVAKLDEWAATVKHHGDQIDGLLGDVERNRKLVARIEALEAWNSEGGVVYGLGTKLENVSDQHEEDRTTIYGQLTEIEETLSQDRLYTVNREREEHKARWHATRDAALQGLLANQYTDDGTTSFVDDAYADAVRLADRAHGPLEGPKVEVNERGHYVVPSDIDVNARLEQLTRRDIDDHVTKEWQRRVGELVKAAQAIATDNWAHGPGFQLPKDLQATTVENVRLLVEALKPFEGGDRG